MIRRKYLCSTPRGSAPWAGSYPWLFVLLLTAPAPVVARDVPVSVITQVSTDWVYHGLSETGGQPVLGVNAEWQISEHWFAGAALHDSEPRRTRQRHRALLWYAGATIPLGEQWYSSLSYKRREFPGSFKNWQYDEYDWRLYHRSGLQLHVDYAPDYYTHDTEAIASQAAWRKHFDTVRGIRWYTGVSAGYLALDEDLDHWFGALNAGASYQLVNLDLTYHWHNQAGAGRFGEHLARPGWVARLSYQLH